ncbi:TPA: hypothetical protein PXO57_004225 [Yersinia enterocolitica]|uniref:hypothetical protein n=1 Tax=Yersinia enterocolitica TaxID=630 RepID=UPI0029BBE926|nr:hypothetical protein [Yersinia enterocolitica]HDL6593440.1 hypothetical protein [Yersinia enterocolitica]HDL7593738.1 hypothetical protein [Yersinia enterocolitica]HEI6814690.1 hypothetical protein [Yersinia enterocolitica]
MENINDTVNIEHSLLPLKIMSYNHLYINVLINHVGLIIEIPGQQLNVDVGDQWEIYYKPVVRKEKPDSSILITKGVFERDGEHYSIPRIQTPSDFFPPHVNQMIKIWYVIRKNDADVFKSSSTDQVLATVFS